jgi:hypothetical protein
VQPQPTHTFYVSYEHASAYAVGERYVSVLLLLRTIGSDRTATFEDIMAWEMAIRRDFHYHFQIDGIPVAYVTENNEYITSRYWAGVPLVYAETPNLKLQGDGTGRALSHRPHDRGAI